jgi:hypothetical protein
MAKLHELLAVDSNLKVQADKTRTELRKTFEGKRHLFAEKKIVTTPLAEGGQQTTEIQSEIQTTVTKELEWFGGHMAKAIDVSYQIGVANQAAKADIVLEDGTVLLKDVPATVLLELEKRVKEMMDLIQAIPTLDPAYDWSFTPNIEEANTYKTLKGARDRAGHGKALGKSVIVRIRPINVAVAVSVPTTV